MIVVVQVADLSHENFKSSRVMRWWLSRLSSRFGAKSSRERKPKWLPGLLIDCDILLKFSKQIDFDLLRWVTSEKLRPEVTLPPSWKSIWRHKSAGVVGFGWSLVSRSTSEVWFEYDGHIHKPEVVICQPRIKIYHWSLVSKHISTLSNETKAGSRFETPWPTSSKSVWRHNFAGMVRLGWNLVDRYKIIGTPRSKPEVEFQCGCLFFWNRK